MNEQFSNNNLIKKNNFTNILNYRPDSQSNFNNIQ